MSTIRSKRNYPSGFEDIKDDLHEFSIKMKVAQESGIATELKHEGQWGIFQIHHQRSRYVYELYYKKEVISRELYDWLLKNDHADGALIAKWKKPGYEHLCCLRCVQAKETNFNSTCICRVPKSQLKEDQDIQCVSCGCRGCASCD